MRLRSIKLLNQTAWGVAISLMLAGCAGERAHRNGLNQIAEGRFDDGLASLRQASKDAPDNVQFRGDYLRRKEEQINRLLAAADTQHAAGELDASAANYRRVLELEPANNRAQASMALLEKERHYAPVMEAARDALNKGDAESAAALLKPLLADASSNRELAELKRQLDELNYKQTVLEPVLKIAQKKPINMEFRDANLGVVLEALARSSGVNIILDQDIKPDLRTTIFLRDSSLENALDLLLQTNRLQKKVLDNNTLLIYPNMPEKVKDYQELVFKGFYLNNTDVRQTQAMIKSMLKTKDIFIDEKLNLIVIRDTPDAIKLAEKLVAMQDMPEPEVMLEVEVIEIDRNKLMNLGIQWPSQLTLVPLNSSGGTSTTLADLKGIKSSTIGATLSNAGINLSREVINANILANPRIRARNHEKAKIMIGDKVPVSTTSTTATGVISESFQYLDVGIKLEVEPTVYLNNDVAIKVGLEVSSLTSQITTSSGAIAYQIGTRTANTLLQLKDGETQVLGGLIGDQDKVDSTRVPGLGDLPLLGRLFSSQKDTGNKSEVILSITPHLIRNIRRPEVGGSEFWSGTERELRTRPLTLRPQVMGSDLKTADEAVTESRSDHTGKSRNVPPSLIALQWQGVKQARVGEQFKLALKVKSDGGLRSLPFQLGFDPLALQLIGIAEGPFFKQNGGQSSLSSNVDAQTGKAFVSVVRSGVDGADGDDAVAILTFRALDTKSPTTEVRLVSVTPVSVGDSKAAPMLPAPYVIKFVD